MMRSSFARIITFVVVHVALQFVNHPYLARPSDYDSVLYRLGRSAGLTFLPAPKTPMEWIPASGTWHSDQLLAHVQSQMRFNYTAQQYSTPAMPVYLKPSTLLAARPLSTRLLMYATVELPRIIHLAATGTTSTRPLLWFLEQHLPAVDTHMNATHILQSGHLDALVKCSSLPQAYNQGPQPQANCSVVLQPDEPNPQGLHWVVAPTATRPAALVCKGNSSRPGQLQLDAFTADVGEGGGNGLCRARSSMLGRPRRLVLRQQLKELVLWLLLPQMPLLRLAPRLGPQHAALSAALMTMGWAACYIDLAEWLLRLCGMWNDATNLWRQNIRRPAAFLTYVVGYQALQLLFLATVYCWSAMALLAPVLAAGWLVQCWVPGGLLAGSLLEVLFTGWMVGLQWVRPAVSSLLLGALEQVQQHIIQPDAVHARVIIGGRVNPQEAANALRALADRVEYLQMGPQLQHLSARSRPVRVLGTHWPAPLQIPPDLDAAGPIPRGFLCPITQDVMQLPAMLIASTIETPATYDKEAIQEWLQNARMDPRSRKPLSEDAQLVPNLELYRAIEDWVDIARGRLAAAAPPPPPQPAAAAGQQQQQQHCRAGLLGAARQLLQPRQQQQGQQGGAQPHPAGVRQPPAAAAQQQQQQHGLGVVGAPAAAAGGPQGLPGGGDGQGAPGWGRLLGHPQWQQQHPQQQQQQQDHEGDLHRQSTSTEGDDISTDRDDISSDDAPGSPSIANTTTSGSTSSSRGRQAHHSRGGAQSPSASMSVSLSSMAAAAVGAVRRAGAAVAGAAAAGGSRQRRGQPRAAAGGAAPQHHREAPEGEEEVMSGVSLGQGHAAAPLEVGQGASISRYNLRRRAGSGQAGQ